jgi:hypothetical protein
VGMFMNSSDDLDDDLHEEEDEEDEEEKYDDARRRWKDDAVAVVANIVVRTVAVVVVVVVVVRRANARAEGGDGTQRRHASIAHIATMAATTPLPRCTPLVVYAVVMVVHLDIVWPMGGRPGDFHTSPHSLCGYHSSLASARVVVVSAKK